VDGRTSVGDLATGVTDLVKRVDAAWRGPRAPQVRLLPELVRADALPAPVPGDRRIPIGIAENDLGPVALDFTADPHLIAFGDVESGKSNLLRLVARGIMARYSPEEALISIVDYRRSLLGAVDGPHLLDYCGSETVLTGAVAQVEAAMRQRLPGPEVTAEQLRDRSWWRGPELFLLIDDYDLVATQTSNPIAPLAQFLPRRATSGCTWSSCAVPVGPAGPCSSRCCNACATWPRPGFSCPAPATRARSSATSSPARNHRVAATW
jgi:S-DNA-T family DNA segregation ATPase FtsK/SpoIIIE